jgi:hypothetical protein
MTLYQVNRLTAVDAAAFPKITHLKNICRARTFLTSFGMRGVTQA